MLSLRRTPHATALIRAYDRAATGWQDRIARLGYPAAYAEVFRAHPPDGNANMLDIGTGSGAFSDACLAACARPRRLTLLDPSKAMLSVARTRLQHKAPLDTVADGVGADLPNAPFDVLLCAHVLEHLADTPGTLRWMRRQLTDRGRLYLVASQPHWCTALLRWKWQHMAFRPDHMRALLRDAGFAGVDLVPFRSGPPSRTSMGYLARAG